MSKKVVGLPSPLVWVSLLIENNCSEFQVNIFSITEIFENVKVFARRRRRRRRQGYDNTSTFSSKTAELKMSHCGYQRVVMRRFPLNVP